MHDHDEDTPPAAAPPQTPFSADPEPPFEDPAPAEPWTTRASELPDPVEVPLPLPDLAPMPPAAEVFPPRGSTAESTIVTTAALALIWRELLAWFKTLFSAAVYATLIVTFGFQVARVEGRSMEPTLGDQDRLIVNKLAYRLGSPRRGDIVMLYYPRDPDKSFVKRVIAEEGDTVKIEDGRVFVNDVPMPDDYVIPENRSHETEAVRVIQSGYYFVMGDHRNNSSDSRTWGEVPKRYIVGRVQLRWWPISHARLF